MKKDITELFCFIDDFAVGDLMRAKLTAGNVDERKIIPHKKQKKP